MEGLLDVFCDYTAVTLRLALLALQVPCAMPMCQSVVRLADGTTRHNLIVVDWFVLLRNQILGFFSTVRTCTDGKWAIFNITVIGLVDTKII